MLVSEVTADVYKKSQSWQIAVTVFFETFGDKNTVINKPTSITCKLEQYLNESIFTNLQVRNNLANATVILDVPHVSTYIRNLSVNTLFIIKQELNYRTKLKDGGLMGMENKNYTLLM